MRRLWVCGVMGEEEAEAAAMRSVSCHPGEGVEGDADASPEPAEPIFEVNRASSSSLPASMSISNSISES